MKHWKVSISNESINLFFRYWCLLSPKNILKQENVWVPYVCFIGPSWGVRGWVVTVDDIESLASLLCGFESRIFVFLHVLRNVGGPTQMSALVSQIMHERAPNVFFHQLGWSPNVIYSVDASLLSKTNRQIGPSYFILQRSTISVPLAFYEYGHSDITWILYDVYCATELVYTVVYGRFA